MLANAYADGSITPGTLAGKPVYTVVTGTASSNQVLVPRDDVLFVVISANNACVNDAIRALP